MHSSRVRGWRLARFTMIRSQPSQSADRSSLHGKSNGVVLSRGSLPGLFRRLIREWRWRPAPGPSYRGSPEPSEVENAVRRLVKRWIKIGLSTATAGVFLSTLPVLFRLGWLGAFDVGVWWSEWTKSSDWDPAAYLAVLAAVAMPLYVATAIGRAEEAISGSPNVQASVIVLESLTSTACLAASTLSVLVLAPAVAGNGPTMPNAALTVGLWAAFSGLAGVSRPSVESRLATIKRTERTIKRLEAVETELHASLQPVSSTLGRRRRKQLNRHLLGALLAFWMVVGLAVNAPSLFSGSPGGVMRWLLAAVLFPLLPVFMCYVDIETWISSETTGFADGQWRARGERLTYNAVALVMLITSFSIALESPAGGLSVACYSVFVPALVCRSLRRSGLIQMMQLRDVSAYLAGQRSKLQSLTFEYGTKSPKPSWPD